jgi:uncharacterized protein
MATNPVLWFEVMGKNGKALRTFYGRLFAWKIEEADPTGSMDYGMVGASDGGVGGGIGSTPDGSPGFATFYVEVDDIDATLAKAEKLGGKTIMPATAVPGMNLTFAYLADPDGHVVGLSRGMRQSQ